MSIILDNIPFSTDPPEVWEAHLRSLRRLRAELLRDPSAVATIDEAIEWDEMGLSEARKNYP